MRPEPGRRRLRILVLSQYYDPEPIPKPSVLAAGLAARGHEVSVVTGFPHYPGSRLYPGWSLAPVRRERRAGLEIVRAFTWPYHGRSVFGRLLNYGSFAVAAPFAALLAPDADVVYVWHPPLTVGIAAWLVARWRRIPFVYDVQDVWPESVAASGLATGRRTLALLGALERFVYAQAARLLVVTDGARENLVAKGVPSSRVAVAPGWAEDDDFAPVPDDAREAARDVLGREGFVALFAGNLGTVQDLDALVSAASRLVGSGVRIAVAGDGADRPRLEALAASLGAGGAIAFLGRRPRAEMPALFAAADALVVSLKPSALAELVIPSKTFGYLAAGRPVVAATGGATERLVGSAGAGISCPPGDSEALAAALRALRDSGADARAAMGARGRAFAREHFSRDAMLDFHERVLESAAQDSD